MTALSTSPSKPSLVRRRARPRVDLGRHHEVVLLLALAAVPLFLTPRIGVSGLVLAAVGAAPVLLNCVGMMLVYRVDGFLNLAQVQVGLLAAALFDGLNRGRIVAEGAQALCPTCLEADPGHLLLRLNFLLSAAIAVGAAVLLSWPCRPP